MAAAADDDVHARQLGDQQPLIGDVLQVAHQDDLVDPQRDHLVDLRLQDRRQFVHVVAAAIAVRVQHRHVAQRGDRGLHLGGNGDDAQRLAALGDAGPGRHFTPRRLGADACPGGQFGRRRQVGAGVLQRGGEQARQRPFASEVQVARQVGELRADAGDVGQRGLARCGRQRGDEIERTGEGVGPEVELMVADGAGLDADGVQDGDVGHVEARGRVADAGEAARRQAEELLVVAGDLIAHRAVGAGRSERAGNEVVAGGQGDAVGDLVFQPVDDGGEVLRPADRLDAAFEIRCVQDLQRVVARHKELSGGFRTCGKCLAGRCLPFQPASVAEWLSSPGCRHRREFH